MDKDYFMGHQKPKCLCKRNRNGRNGKMLSDMDQRTFVSFATDVVSIVAFIFFGSVIFWVTVTKCLIDAFKKIYYHSNKYTRYAAVGVLSLLFLSITVHSFLNHRAWKSQIAKESKAAAAKNSSVSSVKKPEPEYLNIKFEDKDITNRIKTNCTLKTIPKKFTVSIKNEKNEELFRTTKKFVVPEDQINKVGRKEPPVIVSFKDVVIDKY